MNNESSSQNEVERFSNFLRSRHLKKTPERFEILRYARNHNGHFDAEALLSELEDSGYHVSRSTIYNTLELLCQCGIVRKLLFDTHQASYEMAEDTHSHLVCTRCGEIREIDLDGIDSTLSRMSFPGFMPSYVSTCIYGICDECRKKETEQEKK